jgi:hypothetical protein
MMFSMYIGVEWIKCLLRLIEIHVLLTEEITFLLSLLSSCTKVWIATVYSSCSYIPKVWKATVYSSCSYISVHCSKEEERFYTKLNRHLLGVSFLLITILPHKKTTPQVWIAGCCTMSGQSPNFSQAKFKKNRKFLFLIYRNSLTTSWERKFLL